MQRTQLLWESLLQSLCLSACSVIAVPHFKVEIVSGRGSERQKGVCVCVCVGVCLCANVPETHRRIFVRTGEVSFPSPEGKLVEKTLFDSTAHVQSDSLERAAACRRLDWGGIRRTLNDSSLTLEQPLVPLCFTKHFQDTLRHNLITP